MSSSLATWQERVASFVRTHQLETTVAIRLLDLMAEVGELSKAHLEATDYGRHPARYTANWEEELGDILFTLVCLANQTGVSLDTALAQALAKYERRLAQHGHPGRSV